MMQLPADIQDGEVLVEIEMVGHVRAVEEVVEGEGVGFVPVFFGGVDEGGGLEEGGVG